MVLCCCFPLRPALGRHDTGGPVFRGGSVCGVVLLFGVGVGNVVLCVDAVGMSCCVVIWGGCR